MVAKDFESENEALYELIVRLTPEQFSTPTQFKGWTIDEILIHLHLWNKAADLALSDEAAFLAFTDELMVWVREEKSMREFELAQIDGLLGVELITAWRDFYQPMTQRFIKADPKARVKWVGPDMSVRSSITARLMETWAHGQAIYDILGVARVNQDRIKNIAVLGANTFDWSFKVRDKRPPDKKPFLKLAAPSGTLWSWFSESTEELIEGTAEEFCQVVTQTRNIKDTSLMVRGEIANEWMDNAQCFAGNANPPPKPNTRFCIKN